MHRVNTFPFIHLNIFHAILNILALTPLLERFESEHGTLTSLALFLGRKWLCSAPPQRNRRPAVTLGLEKCQVAAQDAGDR